MELTNVGALKTLLSEVLLLAKEQHETRREIRETHCKILENLTQLLRTSPGSPSSRCSLDSAQTVEIQQLPQTDAVLEPSASTAHTTSMSPDTLCQKSNLHAANSHQIVGSRVSPDILPVHSPDTCLDEQLQIQPDQSLENAAAHSDNAGVMIAGSGPSVTTAWKVTEGHESNLSLLLEDINSNVASVPSPLSTSSRKINGTAQSCGKKKLLLPTLNTSSTRQKLLGHQAAAPVIVSEIWRPAVPLSQNMYGLQCHEHSVRASFITTTVEARDAVDDPVVAPEKISVCDHQHCTVIEQCLDSEDSSGVGVDLNRETRDQPWQQSPLQRQAERNDFSAGIGLGWGADKLLSM